MEIAFWQGFLILSVIATVFVIWPTIVVRRDRKSELQTDSHTEASEVVFEDHIKELEDTHSRGEIDAAQMEELRKDLEQTHSSELSAAGSENDKPIIANFRTRLPVLCLVLVFPLLSLAIYSQIGSKSDWEIYTTAVSRGEVKTPEERRALTRKLIDKLHDRLDDKPESVQNWYLLANAATEVADYDEAVRAYGKILELQPGAAQITAEYAQALFLRAGKTVTPEVRKYTELAISMDPNSPTALGLAGIDAFQSGAYQKAIDSWQRAMRQLNPKSQASKVLADGVKRAESALRKSGGKVADNSKASGNTEGLEVEVAVSLDKTGVSAEPDHHVFVYARAWQGPKLPLAIQRFKVGELPKKLVLDQSMAMAPGMDLSSFPQVEVVARISKSGSATPAPGDWQVTAGPIVLAEQRDIVNLIIKEQIQ